jgi:hypothetical protein
MTQPYQSPYPTYAPPPQPPPVQYASPGLPMYRSSAGRGRVMRGLLWLMVALELAGLGVSLYQLRLPPGALESDEVTVPLAFLLTLAVWGLAYTAAIIATIVVVCMWMYRAHANLRALGVRDLDYTSGWAAGAWFVPFLNLVRPFRIMKEIWKGSEGTYEDPARWKLAPVPSFIGWWWATWLISNFASNMSFRMDLRGDANVQYAALWIDVFTVPVSVAAAWFLIRISRGIDAMQASRTEALARYYTGSSAYAMAYPAAGPG